MAVGKTDYGLEGMSPNYLSRNGWSKRTLKTGDKVTLKVYPLKDAAIALKDIATRKVMGKVLLKP